MLDRVRRKLDAWPSVMLTLCALFWAGNAVASRLAIGQITPFTLVLLRWVLVICVLWPIYGAQVRAHWEQIWPKRWRVVMMATLGFTGFNALFYAGAQYTTAINIGILQGSIPVFVLMGAFAAHGTHGFGRQSAQFLALQQNAATDHFAGPVDQPHDGVTGHGFAGA